MALKGTGKASYPRREGREFWALALELQRESGLAMAAFCRREAPCRLALPRFYLGREARCRTRVRINSACMGGDRNRKLAKKQPPDFGNPNCRLARSV